MYFFTFINTNSSILNLFELICLNYIIWVIHVNTHFFTYIFNYIFYYVKYNLSIHQSYMIEKNFGERNIWLREEKNKKQEYYSSERKYWKKNINFW